MFQRGKKGLISNSDCGQIGVSWHAARADSVQQSSIGGSRGGSIGQSRGSGRSKGSSERLEVRTSCPYMRTDDGIERSHLGRDRKKVSDRSFIQSSFCDSLTSMFFQELLVCSVFPKDSG